MIWLSVKNVTLWMSMSISSTIKSVISTAKTATQSSRCGMVCGGCVASFDLPMMNPVWICPSISVVLRYATADIAMVEASQKTQSSLCVVEHREVDT